MSRAHKQPYIGRGIARSRRAMAAMRSRHHRLMLAAAAIAAGLAVVGTLSLRAFVASDSVRAAASEVKSLADLMKERSPGQRTEGQLTKTKNARAFPKIVKAARSHAGTHKADEPEPDLVELSTLLASGSPLPAVAEAPLSLAGLDFQRPPSTAAIVALPPATSPQGITVPGTAPGTAPAAVPGSPPGAVPGSPPGAVPGSPPGTVPGSPPGTGPGSPPGTVPGSPPSTGPGSPPATVPASPPGTVPGSPPTEIIPVPSAVPESGTWTTMLLGFALIGRRIRLERVSKSGERDRSPPLSTVFLRRG